MLFATGCGVFTQEESRTPIAKVKEHTLFADELQAALPADLTVEDSTRFADNFIAQWATEMLLLDKAELNLTDKQKDVSAQLEEYRSSLIIYLYQKQLLRQQLDTTVSAEEIGEYYNNNKQNFELRDNIARAVLVKLSKDSEDVEKVKKLMRSDKQENREELEEYCGQHALSYHLNTDVWIPFNDLLEQMPQVSYLNLNYFSLYKFAEVQDSTARYLLRIKEIKYKNSVSPLEFEQENIRNILLNQRKLELIRKLEKDIFEEAVSKNEFKILSE
ncbi:MAG: hypothetical protein JKX84_00845 [Flavobacteriales bacterium]|nr:hypothetical protein [Flavobacteriales bacterium]